MAKIAAGAAGAVEGIDRDYRNADDKTTDDESHFECAATMIGV